MQNERSQFGLLLSMSEWLFHALQTRQIACMRGDREDIVSGIKQALQIIPELCVMNAFARPSQLSRQAHGLEKYSECRQTASAEVDASHTTVDLCCIVHLERYTRVIGAVTCECLEVLKPRRLVPSETYFVAVIE